MELAQLRLFAAVAETENFTRAAERMFVSHSSVSRAVSTLETELGVRLMERRNRVFGLTEAGEKLYVRAKELLALAESIEDEMRDCT